MFGSVLELTLALALLGGRGGNGSPLWLVLVSTLQRCLILTPPKPLEISNLLVQFFSVVLSECFIAETVIDAVAV